MHCSSIFCYELQKSNWLQITANHVLYILILYHSFLIIIITDSISIEYTSLNGLESKVLNVLPSFLPSFLSSIMYQSISMVCNLYTFHSYLFNRSWFHKHNHSNTILFMNCIQSDIMPKNHSWKTTVYQSLCTTIDSNGIHNKLQFLIHTLVIPVAITNKILHATQNKIFHENGNNRIKHSVQPMKWQDRVCLDFVCLDAKLCLSYAVRFGMC